MPLPAHDWSRPATHYSPQAFDPYAYEYEQHGRDADYHAHDLPAGADLQPLLAHLAAYPTTRGAHGWVAHRHA